MVISIICDLDYMLAAMLYVWVFSRSDKVDDCDIIHRSFNNITIMSFLCQLILTFLRLRDLIMHVLFVEQCRFPWDALLIDSVLFYACMVDHATLIYTAKNIKKEHNMFCHLSQRQCTHRISYKI